MLKIRLLFALVEHPQRTILKPIRNVKFLLGVVISLLAVGFTKDDVAAQLQSGLVGYWSLNEGIDNTAGDSSGNGNTGALLNGPIWSSGKVGQSLSFDGADDYVEVPHAQSLNLSAALTVSVWINNETLTDSGLGQDQYRIIASKGSATDDGSWTLAWRVNDGSLFFFVGRDTSYRYARFSYDNSQAGTWHLVTAVLPNGTISLYQDGVLKAGPVGIDSNTIRTSTSPLRIGSVGWTSISVRNWDGLLDEVRVYNRAFSAEEILSLYQQDNQAFNFSLANSMDLSAAQGASATNTITANLVTGSSETVSFSASGLPSGASAAFSQKTCNPACNSLLTIATAASTPTGTFTITVTGTGGEVTKTTGLILTVASAAATAIISPAQGTTLTPGQIVTATGSGTNLSWDIDLISDGISSFKTGTGSSITFTVPANANSSQIIRNLTGDNGSVTRDYGIVTAPTPPPTSAAQLTLSWQDNSDNEDNFAIEKKTGTSGTYTQIALVAANSNSYVDTTVTKGVDYCYRVRAVNGAGASASTNEACKAVP